METKNKRFAIEDLVDLVTLKHHAVVISFIPGSKSYHKYENGITLLQIINVRLEEALLRITQHKAFTYGEIVGSGYDNTPPIDTGAISVSFNTEDIEEIEYRK